MPITIPFKNIMDFGARPNDDSAAAKAANSAAFEQAQAAMNNAPDAFGHLLFVPSGRFYLAKELRIWKSLELFGTGIRGESILVLPHQDVVAGQEKASIIIDPPGAAPDRTGTNCVIRDIQIHSASDWANRMGNQPPPPYALTPQTDPALGTPGIELRAQAYIERVYIAGFIGSGIYVHGDHNLGTNANQWRIKDVFVDACGGHGIHVEGSESQGGLCTGALIMAGGGNGIQDSSGGGNTYVGCYAEEMDFGRGYETDSPGQVSFIGCFSEALKPTRLAVGGHVWIGGSARGFEDSTAAFIVQSLSELYPFAVYNNVQTKDAKLMLGYNDGSNAVYGWSAKGEDGNFWLMRWLDSLQIWSTERGNDHPPSPFQVSYQTGTGHVRGLGLQGFPALLVGSAEAEANPNRSKAVRLESLATAGSPPPDGPYQRGDLILRAPADYDDQQNLPEFVGWVCVNDANPGPNRLVWKQFGKIEL